MALTTPQPRVQSSKDNDMVPTIRMGLAPNHSRDGIATKRMGSNMYHIASGCRPIRGNASRERISHDRGVRYPVNVCPLGTNRLFRHPRNLPATVARNRERPGSNRVAISRHRARHSRNRGVRASHSERLARDRGVRSL